jgi:SOS response regulatory protein OraA/RecX
VRDRLTREGLSQGAIDHAVARCTKLGYLDDAAEEERRLEREIAKGKGPFVIRQLGFSEGDIARLFPEERQMSVIERLAEKKKSLPRQKLAQFLQRRGFPLSLILDTLGDR